MSSNENPDSVRTAVNRQSSVVTGNLKTLTGDPVYFETDQPLGTTPTLYIPLATASVQPLRKFELTEVCYYMNPTNAVTYQLMLLEKVTADDVDQLGDLVWFSPAAQADSVCYRYNDKGYCASMAAMTAEVIQYKLPCIVQLDEPAKLYYMLDWSGAPGTTAGFIKIRGRLLK